MDELTSYNPEYGPFFAWVRRQGQEMQARVEADVQQLLLVFDIDPGAKAVLQSGRDAASRLQQAALAVGCVESAHAFEDDYDYCCFMLGMQRR